MALHADKVDESKKQRRQRKAQIRAKKDLFKSNVTRRGFESSVQPLLQADSHGAKWSRIDEHRLNSVHTHVGTCQGESSVTYHCLLVDFDVLVSQEQFYAEETQQ